MIWGLMMVTSVGCLGLGKRCLGGRQGERRVLVSVALIHVDFYLGNISDEGGGGRENSFRGIDRNNDKLREYIAT